MNHLAAHFALAIFLASFTSRALAETQLLLEDNAATLLPLLTNPTGDSGQGFVEHAHTFSGQSAIRIIPMQRFGPNLAGWNYPIVEKPGPGQYRYIRFAWKSPDCIGTMLQLHIATGWSIRYYAGHNAPGWGAKQIAPNPPRQWTMITCDLFADFGECTVNGIAFTAFHGKAAYFDHVYLAQTIEELDAINANPPGDPARKLNPADLERLWLDLCSDDDARSYRAQWTLAIHPTESAPFLKHKAQALPANIDRPAIAQWILDLEHPDPDTRTGATEHLSRHIDAAEDLLRQQSTTNPSPEVRSLATAILKSKDSRGPWPNPAIQAVHALRHMRSSLATTCLTELAAGPAESPATKAARAAPKAP